MKCHLHPKFLGDVFPRNDCSTCWDVFDIKNNVEKRGGKKFMPNGQEIVELWDGTKILGAPQWLKDQMEAARNRPPPTSEEVRLQFATCARLRRENARCPKHKEYDMVKPPEEGNDCDGCWCAYFDRHQTDEARKLYWEAMDKYDGLKTV